MQQCRMLGYRVEYMANLRVAIRVINVIIYDTEGDTAGQKRQASVGEE